MQAQKINQQEKDHLIEKVRLAIDSIRPYLEADGGDISILNITDDMKLEVALHGACQTCNMSQMTLKAGVAEAVKHAVPEIKDVIAVNI
ncbi:MAG: NifU family protein [Flavobacteriales bacterium]